MANFCWQCGQKVPVIESKFCSSCGSPLDPSIEKNLPYTPDEKYLKRFSSSGRKGLSDDPKFFTGSRDLRPIIDLLNSQSESGDQDLLQDKELFAEIFEIYNIDAPLVTPADISQGAYSFENAINSATGYSASNWWESSKHTHKEMLSSSNIDLNLQIDGELEVSEYFTHHNKILEECESVPWGESALGQRFIKILEELGVGFGEFIIGMQFNETGEMGVERTSLMTDKPEDLRLGRWSTPNGFEFTEIGQTFRSKETGTEYVYWYIEALVRTRCVKEKNDFSPSSGVFIPYVLQNALFLAETPFPGVVKMMLPVTNRRLAFGGETNENLPIPLIQTIHNGRVTAINKINPELVETYITPEITRLGYIFDSSMSEEQLRRFIPRALDSLSVVPGILLDGYANHNGDSEINFQAWCCADISLYDEGIVAKFGSVVPGLIFGELCEKSNHVYNRIYNHLTSIEEDKNPEEILEANMLMFALADNGVGPIFCHAANTACYTLIELSQYNPDGIELLDYVSSYSSDFQNGNALSNLALMNLVVNDLEGAEGAIDRAILAANNRFESIVKSLHSKAWKMSDEITIVEEIYETFFEIKASLGKLEECKRLAPEVISFCEQNEIYGELLTIAKSF